MSLNSFLVHCLFSIVFLFAFILLIFSVYFFLCVRLLRVFYIEVRSRQGKDINSWRCLLHDSILSTFWLKVQQTRFLVLGDFIWLTEKIYVCLYRQKISLDIGTNQKLQPVGHSRAVIIIIVYYARRSHKNTKIHKITCPWHTYQKSTPKTGTKKIGSGLWRVWHAIWYRLFWCQFLVTNRRWSILVPVSGTRFLVPVFCADLR